jgi:[ribosomal protein S5]-alanine N-acetyltransferase
MPIRLPIETERLTIRKFDPDEDADALFEVYGDPEVMRLIPGGAFPDLKAVRARLEQYAGREIGMWAIVLREIGRPIGDVGFNIFRQTGDVEIGWTLARRSWGRGYATEAAGACLTAGLTDLDVPRIIAIVDADNAASLRVAERIGMQQVETIEAYGRPHVLFEARR